MKLPNSQGNISVPFLIVGIVCVAVVVGGVVLSFRVRDNESASETQSQEEGMGNMQDTMDNMHNDDVLVNPVNPSDIESNSPTPATSQNAKAFTVSGQNFSYSVNELRVSKGDTVRITFQNTGGTHNLVVEGYNKSTPIIQTGQSATVEFVADKAGTFAVYCSVDGHRQMGMEFPLIVQ